MDASAIIRFARGGDLAVGVGEIMSEVDDEGAAVGLPVLCLAEAFRVVEGEGHGDLVKLLWQHRASRLLVSPEDFYAVAAAIEIVGRWDAAVAAVLAYDFDVSVLSTTPALYAGFGDPDFVIEV